MTNFEKLVSEGPEVLAKLIVDSKIAFGDAVANELGFPHKTTDELRKSMIKVHYDYLTAEYKG